MQIQDKQVLIKAMVENLVYQQIALVKYSPEIMVEELSDVAFAHSAIADATFNFITYARFSESTSSKRIEQVLSHYLPSQTPFIWWTTPTDSPASLQKDLAHAGLSLRSDDPGMVCPLNEIEMELPTSELVIQRVMDDIGLKLFSDISSAVTEHESFYDYMLKYLPAHLYQGNSTFEFYVGTLHGKPVCTGLLVYHADVAGVYYIATLPEVRGKGYGSLMVRFLQLTAKKKGISFATLQAAADGVNIYRRLGFVDTCHFQEYTQTA